MDLSAVVVAFWAGVAVGVWLTRGYRAAEIAALHRVNAEYELQLEDRESLLP